ncbi:MAG: GerMN domain-containing protein [Actinomycetota bacterium]|nr:GerMN domain-containing protein [Actinomycetota bacterium]MDZ4181181.1 GerMN domain-containing protein [Coriobacteriia bacterium]
MPIRGFVSSQTCVALVVIAVLALLVTVGCSPSVKADEGELDMLSIDEMVAVDASEVSVFYPSGDVIAEEKVVVDEGESFVLAALRELFKAQPRDPGLKVTLPPATVNSVLVEDGVAWIDFSSDVLVLGESVETQRVVLAAIIYTATQFDGIERVAFTVEGQSSGTVDGKNVELFWGDVKLSEQPWSLTAERTSEEGVQ